jgi:hypothetical protein
LEKKEEIKKFNTVVHDKEHLFAYKSLYSLDITNKFRLAMIWTHEWVWFDRFILSCILLNSLFLAMNDYSYRMPGGSKSWRNDLVEQSEIVFLVLFTMEALVKITGMGFVMEKGTYLRDGWNVLDFIVVIVGWIGFVPGVTSLTVLRTVRILRPLKSIKAITKMKVLVNSLIKSIPAIANVALFCVFLFTIFGIIGINLMSGSLYQR